VAIVVIIAIVVALNRERILDLALITALVVVLHNGLGLAAGYLFARWLGFDERTCRTLAIEVGMQNSGLAAALASKHLSVAAALPGALFSVWHNLSGAALAGWWSRPPDSGQAVDCPGAQLSSSPSPSGPISSSGLAANRPPAGRSRSTP
jgi:BASS family bile acid:Na+ symporter